MKFFIAFILSFFFLSYDISAFCVIKQQAFPKAISTVPVQNSVLTTPKLTFKQRFVLKYLSKADKKGEKALENLFIVGFLFLIIGFVLVKTSVGFSGIIGAITGFVCALFGSLILLTAIILSIVN